MSFKKRFNCFFPIFLALVVILSIGINQFVSEVYAQEMKPITIKLPKPMFIGTPQDRSVPNLEKPLGKPRPPLLAPVGTENVALGKAISSPVDQALSAFSTLCCSWKPAASISGPSARARIIAARKSFCANDSMSRAWRSGRLIENPSLSEGSCHNRRYPVQFVTRSV